MTNWKTNRVSRLLGVIASLVAGATIAACNTVEGVGKDVESAGDAVKDTARDAKN